MIFKELFLSLFITILTVVMKKSAFLELGPFLPYNTCEDYDLFLKCAAKYPIDYVDEPLAKYRVHESNYSKNYEVEVNECIKIYDYWRNRANINGYNMKELTNQAMVNTYYNAFKNAIRRRKDYKGARKYFLLFFYSWVRRLLF
jgi:hypothetical protein